MSTNHPIYQSSLIWKIGFNKKTYSIYTTYSISFICQLLWSSLILLVVTLSCLNPWPFSPGKACIIKRHYEPVNIYSIYIYILYLTLKNHVSPINFDLRPTLLTHSLSGPLLSILGVWLGTHQATILQSFYSFLFVLSTSTPSITSSIFTSLHT